MGPLWNFGCKGRNDLEESLNMQVQVIASGYLKKFTRSDISIATIEIEDGATVRDLVNLLQLPEEESFIIAIDGRLVPFGHTLCQDDQVRIIPPISGGSE